MIAIFLLFWRFDNLISLLNKYVSDLQSALGLYNLFVESRYVFNTGHLMALV